MRLPFRRDELPTPMGQKAGWSSPTAGLDVEKNRKIRLPAAVELQSWITYATVTLRKF
jgi:hypothetical protein